MEDDAEIRARQEALYQNGKKALGRPAKSECCAVAYGGQQMEEVAQCGAVSDTGCMLRAPFYDPTKSYYDNLEFGPFNGFVDGAVLSEEEPRFEFLGVKVAYPFGIPAGPLLDSKFIKGAFDKGFDVAVYKTVRANEFPCHPHPNVLAVHIDGDLTLEKAKKPLVADEEYREPLSITNSFGVPSRSSEEWLADAKKAVGYARKGQ